VSASQVQSTDRRDRPVRIRFSLNFLGVDLILRLLNKLVGAMKDLSKKLVGLVEGPLSTNFLFIFSFSSWRARISSSFFRLVSSFFLIISVISFYRDIKSAICSAFDIFSFTMLQVDTIYFILQVDYLDPAVGAHCSRTGLGPRELLELLLIRSINSLFLLLQTSSLLFFCHTTSRSPQSPSLNGT